MQKVKVSFEVTYSWTRGDFRVFIGELLKTENIEVYIISDEENTDYVDSVGATIGIPDARVLKGDKVDLINEYDIDIHLDSSEPDIIDIEEATGARTVLVLSRPDQEGRPKYIQYWEFALKQVVDEKNIKTG